MAIYHLGMKSISRSSGRSAVASAAYRSGERLTNERDGLTHDFTRESGIEHAEIVLPQGSLAEWAWDRSTLWNAAERCEKRKDSRVAREIDIALPHELSQAQQLELTREFAQSLADRYSAAVDFAIHARDGDETGLRAGQTDVRNFQAYLMMTTRAVGPNGFLHKTDIERQNAWLLSQEKPVSQMQLREIRQSWALLANEHLARAGFAERIDHRSHQDRGLEIEPTEHMGINATHMQRRGLEVSRVRLDPKAALRNASMILEKPEQLLYIIAGEKAIFDRGDVANALHRYIDQPEAFAAAFAKVMASPALVELHAETSSAPARYSTRDGSMKSHPAKS